jgi:ABC-type Fe3+/spermidine/putrescine transport system ATPase subunit
LEVSSEHPVRSGDACTVAIRPENIELAPARSGSKGLLGRVRSVAFAGNSTLYVVEALGREFRVRRPNTAVSMSGVAVDDRVALSWAPDAALILLSNQGAD